MEVTVENGRSSKAGAAGRRSKGTTRESQREAIYPTESVTWGIFGVLKEKFNFYSSETSIS